MSANDAAALEALHAELRDKLLAFTTGEDWLAWIADARRFHRYSARNQLLLAVQGARGHVASYRAWQRIPAVDGGHCQVRRGERGLTILAPMTVTHREVDESSGEEIVVGRSIRGFRAVKVFHQGQLVAPPDLADPPLPELLVGPDRWEHVWNAVVAQLRDDDFDVTLHTAERGETWNGRTRFTDRAVEVMAHLEPPQRIKTLLHEWAHVALGHGDPLQTTSRELREVEAESVAYLVCTTIGLDSSDYSIPYLAGWSGGDGEVAERTAQHVLATTAQLIERLEARLGIDLTVDQLAAAAAEPAGSIPTRDREIAGVVSVHDAAAVDPASTSVPLERGAGPSGAVRSVLDGLSSSDGEVLVAALAQLDDPDALSTAAALCADAGASAEVAAEVLRRAGADELGLRRALTRTVTNDEGEQVPMFDGAHDALRRSRAAAALDGLDEVDRVWLENLDVGNPLAVDAALHHLRDRRDIDDDQISAIAAHLGIDHRLDVGGDEPAPTSDDPAIADRRPTTTSSIAGHDRLLRDTVDAGRDPTRIAALAVGLGMRPEETIAALGRLGLDPELTAAVALARRGGDIEAAAADLETGWDALVPDGGWSAYLPAGASPPSPVESPVPGGRRSAAAHAIVEQWMAMSPNASAGPTMG